MRRSTPGATPVPAPGSSSCADRCASCRRQKLLGLQTCALGPLAPWVLDLRERTCP